jgi:methionyl-tRNA synthetase
MIISTFRPDQLSAAFGIDMSPASGVVPGAGWGRVVPGGSSAPHQHDEIEMFVIVQGIGELMVDGRCVRVAPGAVATFEPFETHVLRNVGEQDLIFFDLYWRDPAKAALVARRPLRRRFDERPVFVFSTPPTPNGDLHLGHLSGPYLGADVFVRFHRMCGVQAWHLTGSDDYQSYVVERAGRDGVTPDDTARHYSAEIADTLRLMDVDVDQYTVTSTDDTYETGLRGFFSRLVSSGSVGPGSAPATVDPDTGDYLYEVDITGGCPGCADPTNGNICEQCGEPNVCTDLADARSHRSGHSVHLRDITRFTLPLHEFRDVVAAHQALGRVPARLRELADRVFARGRLDLPMTHVSGWGVAPAEADVDGQVIWVWPEMAYGFLHGVQRLGERIGRRWRADSPEQDWKIVHFFGYDNSFYHSLLYPVLYRLAFPGWAPDIDYHVNEFYLLIDEKFSTSRRHAIWGKEILNPGSVDGVRYFLARTRPEGRRTNFDPDEYIAAVRDTLIGSWQCWLNQLGIQVKHRHGGRAPDAGIWTPEHTAFLGRLSGRLSTITGFLDADGFSLNGAAAELNGIVEDVRWFGTREYTVADSTHWRDQTRTATALELAAAWLVACCAAPVMPRFARDLATRLGMPEPTSWPRTVELVPAGTVIDLADAEFFATPRLPDRTTHAAEEFAQR